MGAIALPQPRAVLGTGLRLGGRIVMLALALFTASILSGAIFQIIPNLTVGQTSGVSMEPGLKNGDVVLVHRSRNQTIELGDVVVFRQNDAVVLHRVIGLAVDDRGQTLITTKGDNNPYADEPVYASEIGGKLVTKVPLLGEASRLLDAGGGLYVYHYAGLALSLGLVLTYVAVTLWRGMPTETMDGNS